MAVTPTDNFTTLAHHYNSFIIWLILILLFYYFINLSFIILFISSFYHYFIIVLSLFCDFIIILLFDYFIVSQGLYPIFCESRRLKVVNVSNCPQITGGCLEVLATNNKMLTTFNAAGTVIYRWMTAIPWSTGWLRKGNDK